MGRVTQSGASMKVPVSGQVSGKPEALAAYRVGMSGHYGGGIETERFEKRFSELNKKRFTILCNSGSSANLIALLGIEQPKGRVVTTAVNFPTTVAAIVHSGHTPVFVDSDPVTLNARNGLLRAAIDSETRAVLVAHTLGNPNDLSSITIPVIEDCCDALGSTIDGYPVGLYSTASTYSFYPAHHATMGEGGAVQVDYPALDKVMRSIRDWGRACWCKPGEDNTCGCRFDGDYDHKYSYDRMGFNLKASDFQAAVGFEQLNRLGGFVDARRSNWEYLRSGLDGLPLEFVKPTPGSVPSWFGFPFYTEGRNKLARYLDGVGIGNRPIMAGNITRQKAAETFEYKIFGDLPGADYIHERGLWIGCWPGLTTDQLDYTIERINDYYR